MSEITSATGFGPPGSLRKPSSTFLVNATGLTWGNLASHLRRLEEHGYVEIDKGYRGRKPHTEVSLSDKGRAAFKRYRKLITEALADLPESPPS